MQPRFLIYFSRSVPRCALLEKPVFVVLMPSTQGKARTESTWIVFALLPKLLAVG